MTAASAPPSTRLERLVAAALVAAAVATYATWGLSGRFAWTVWADRDLLRAAVPLDQLSTSGAELSFGGGARVPGGGLNLGWHLLLWAGLGPTGLWRVQLGVAVAAALGLGGVVARRTSALSGALVVAWTLAHPLATGVQERLWNPAWAAAPATLAAAVLLGGPWTREPLRWLTVGALVAVGAHAHLAAGLVGAVAIALWSREGRPGLALLGAAATYLPFVVAELGGAGALAALLGSDQVGTVSPTGLTVEGVLDELRRAGAVLLGVGALNPDGSAGAQDMPRLLLTGVVSAGACVVCLRADASRRPVAVVLLVLALYALAPGLDAGNLQFERFLVPLAPWVAAAVGVGAATRGWWTAGPAVLAATWLVVEQREEIATRVEGALDAPGVMAAADALTDALGPPADWLGRVAWLQLVDEGRAAEPVDLIQLGWLAAGEVRTSVGTCALVIDHDPGARVDGGAVRAWLAPSVGEVVFLGVRALTERRAIVRYASEARRCAATVSPRYWTSADERRVADLPQAPGTVRRLADGAVSEWAVVAPRHPGAAEATAWRGLVRVTRRGDDVVAELHANALRGKAWNSGPWVSERVVRPRLVARTGDGAQVELLWSPGRVGVFGVLTPLSSAGALPADANLFLEYEVDAPLVGGLPPGVLGTTVSVPLSEGASPPPG